MAEINRDIFLKPFTKNNFPRFICPTCREGIVKIDVKLFMSCITESSRTFNDMSGEVDGMIDHFSFIAKCDNEKCKEIITMSGISVAEEGYVKQDIEDIMAGLADDYSEPICINHFDIKYVYPAIRIIDIGEKVPSNIERTLNESFSLFWDHQSSAGNKIRHAIELLMDNKKITNIKINKKGKAINLTLHDRLVEFVKTDKKMADLLMSVKWLGNAGSHKSAINKEDLLVAYEVLDYVLDELFEKNDKLQKINQLSQALTKKFKK